MTPERMKFDGPQSSARQTMITRRVIAKKCGPSFQAGQCESSLRCQDVIRICLQLISIYLLLDPSSNHKLLSGCDGADICSLESERKSVRLRLDDDDSSKLRSAGPAQQEQRQSQAATLGNRVKRSPKGSQLNIWDQIELLLRAYQEARRHEDRQRVSWSNFDNNNDQHQDNGQVSGPPLREPRVGQSRQEGHNQLPVGNGDSNAANEQTQAVKVIETAVFIDQALDNKFAGLSNGLVELNKLVLTIMNQVQYLFEYSSLQVAIKLKLVLIEHLKESERLIGLAAPNSERGDIDAYLSNFCNWQQGRLEREKRLWWDHAILLSGLDLYKATPGKNHSGVLGLAWVGGMCNGNYSCTINEASNFESAFVIAHEIGHSLGIMHDGQKNKCDPNQFIMSERTGAGKVHWSRCSNGYLSESIARGKLKCLENEQNNQVDSLYDLAKLRSPGQVYTINEQCKLAFGANYSSFVTQQAPYNAVCRELWCVSGTWAKAAHPALDGSSCGGHQEFLCREGKCTRQVSN